MKAAILKAALSALTVASAALLSSCAAPRPRIYFYEEAPSGTGAASAPASDPDSPDISSVPDAPADTPLELSVPEEYAGYYETNRDLVGWLEIPGIISMPIVQAGDNGTYLTKNFDGTVSSYSAAAFADFRCALDSRSSNAVLIYGHNLLSGEGFSKLTEYYPWKRGASGSAEFAENNPVISYHDFYKPDKDRNYAVFAAACLTADASDPYYIDPSVLVMDNRAFGSVMPSILDRSVFYANDIDVSPSDGILMLSTCIDIMGRDYETRFMIFARRLRENEDIGDAAPDISVNPDPLYFQAYYDMTGTSWGGRKWDPGLISDKRPVS